MEFQIFYFFIQLMSYGGRLAFAVYFYAKHSMSVYSGSPTIIIRGKLHDKAIGYYLPEPENGQTTRFSLFMREVCVIGLIFCAFCIVFRSYPHRIG